MSSIIANNDISYPLTQNQNNVNSTTVSPLVQYQKQQALKLTKSLNVANNWGIALGFIGPFGSVISSSIARDRAGKLKDLAAQENDPLLKSKADHLISGANASLVTSSIAPAVILINPFLVIPLGIANGITNIINRQNSGDLKERIEQNL